MLHKIDILEDNDIVELLHRFGISYDQSIELAEKVENYIARILIPVIVLWDEFNLKPYRDMWE